MSGKQRRNLIRILVASAMMAALHFAPARGLLRFALYLVPYLVVGYDILIKAVKGLVRRRPFDECLLMAVATVGAMALAVYEDGDYAEGIAVMLFYQVGEWFQSYAVGKSRRSVSALMDIRPDHANVECDGRLKRVDPEDVPVGTVITVLAGERVPIDGVVIEGSSSLNASALTGESLPRDVAPGDGIVSGCVNGGGVLRVRTTKEFGRSTVSRILELVEDAGSRKSRSEAFISRFARVYTPAVVFGAALLALLPPLVRVAAMGLEPAWGSWVYRALTFLVVSCPCALVISIPLSFFAGIGGAGREGVLVKGSNYLEALAQTRTVVFDKTGTLTKGVFEVTAVHPERLDERGLLHLAAHVERYSTHPVGNSLRRAYPDEADDCRVEDVQEVAGQGVRARVNGRTVCVGNPAMMESVGAAWHPCNRHGTIIHVAIDGEYAGHVVIADVVKPSAREAVAELRRAGVRRTVMLTGDDRGTADLVARELGLDEAWGGLLPADKVARVEALIEEGRGGKLAFVGDGINDAPVLARADVGIAMGAMGSDAAIEAADVVLMDDDPLKIAKAIRISRRCLGIVRQNIAFAIGVKLLCLALGALGYANLWFAVFADVGVMVLAVLNAMRALFVRNL
ncbi:heavy metal translocating P-type ATPase [uncultured Fretibacterium sp.]|uniref:heavy metal translocating P-type ATPase n=1 Tax=uncultured Fretibacterium sp. TaxID=1678694 RepID=UPI002637C739|nr:heavy metal translocating P-type ATPase [uncultured Fretibacterium sp.]